VVVLRAAASAVVAAAASKAFYIDNAVLSLPLSDRSGPAFSQRRPPHTVISNEAGRFFFFRVRSCERVGLRREKSPFFFPSFSSGWISQPGPPGDPHSFHSFSQFQIPAVTSIGNGNPS